MVEGRDDIDLFLHTLAWIVLILVCQIAVYPTVISRNH